MKDKANFKAEEDVAALRKAIEGIGKSVSHLYWYQYYVKRLNYILLDPSVSGTICVSLYVRL